MIGRLLTRLIDAQAAWSRPLGNGVHALLHPLFQRLAWLRDLLDGRWLGHPLHPALTDAPIGMLFLVSVFDVIGQRDAATVSLVLGLLAMLGAALPGLADFADTDGRARERAAVHGTVMVVALVGYLVSLVLRLGDGGSPAAAWAAGLSFAVVILGAYVGGDVAYVLGNMVNRHAFRGAGTKWIVLEPAELEADGSIPIGRPIRAKLGINGLVLVNDGSRVLALHDTCAHGNGPLAEGRLHGGQLECPWHGSRFDLATGHVRRGPSVYDQPAYEVRPREGGGWEARRATADRG